MHDRGQVLTDIAVVLADGSRTIGDIAMHQAEVTILAGTDAGALGVAYGASLHRELELLVLVGAGLTALEALRAATAGPAAVFGLKDRGRIRAGLAADLLLIDGDPTTDITATASERGIWRRGCQVERQKPAGVPR